MWIIKLKLVTNPILVGVGVNLRRLLARDIMLYMKVKQVDEVSYDVEGSNGEVYLIWYSRGRWTCDCMGFQCNGVRPDFRCKHIRGVLEFRLKKLHEMVNKHGKSKRND